jgi:hypothetical protein
MVVNTRRVERGNLSNEQFSYALARALYETRQEAYVAESEASVKPRDVGSDFDTDRFIAEDAVVFDKHRVKEAFDLLVLAEDALIAWADKCARRNLGKTRYRQIEEVFKTATSSGMKHRLLKICMEMKDEKGGV